MLLRRQASDASLLLSAVAILFLTAAWLSDARAVEVVGTTPGTFAVNQVGAATYTILINAPVATGYTPPPSASVPAFDYEPLVRNGVDFGATSIEYDDASLVCSAIGDGKFRLEGDISVTPSSYIKISNELPSIGMCSGTSRTPENISHTEAHELVHANALVGVINDHKAQIGTEYSSQSSCESTLATLRSSLAADFASEVTRQANHLDHRGERRHAAVCPTPGGDTMEVVCGLKGWECQPGNFYPGR